MRGFPGHAEYMAAVRAAIFEALLECGGTTPPWQWPTSVPCPRCDTPMTVMDADWDRDIPGQANVRVAPCDVCSGVVDLTITKNPVE